MFSKEHFYYYFSFPSYNSRHIINHELCYMRVYFLLETTCMQNAFLFHPFQTEKGNRFVIDFWELNTAINTKSICKMKIFDFLFLQFVFHGGFLKKFSMDIPTSFRNILLREMNRLLKWRHDMTMGNSLWCIHYYFTCFGIHIRKCSIHESLHIWKSR